MRSRTTASMMTGIFDFQRFGLTKLLGNEGLSKAFLNRSEPKCVGHMDVEPLARNGLIDDVHGADFANSDGDPFDDQMHGTHCAGTIAGHGNNAEGVAGVAWAGVRLMALKFLSASGGGRTSDAIKCLNYAVAHGAKITSNSWGGGGSSSAMRVREPGFHLQALPFRPLLGAIPSVVQGGLEGFDQTFCPFRGMSRWRLSGRSGPAYSSSLRRAMRTATTMRDSALPTQSLI